MTLEVTENSSTSLFLENNPPPQRGIVKEIRETYYACQYQKALQQIEMFLNHNQNMENFYEILLLKSHCLYELHELKAARKVIDDAFQVFNGGNDLNCLYAKASLAFFDGEYNQALQTFSTSLQISKSPQDNFKSLLGLGNTYYGLKEYRNVLPYLKELSNLENLVSDDFKISYYLLCANTHLYSQSEGDFSKKYFEQAYELSVINNWNYFVQRSLYGLSCFEKEKGDEKKLEGILSILNLRLKIGESKFLTYLTNEKFSETGFSVKQNIVLAKSTKSITINKQSFNFAHSPLMFTIIDLLSSKNIFFSKAQIANALWPQESYKKRTHDPRIYDLIKRIRKIVEAEESRPVVILSNPLGYKLTIH